MIADMTFHDDAFVDFVADATPSGSGHFNMEALGPINQPLTLPADFAILEAAVVGSNITDWVSLRTSEARLTLGFSDLIAVDGPGDDLAIVERFATAPMDVTINGITQSYISQPHGGDVNFVPVDLADFGVAQASTFTIASNSILNDTAAAAVINYVPEPSTLVLAAVGIVVLLYAQRSKR
jgi:hypothetical protein